MRIKKKKPEAGDLTPDQELERKVDAMMDLKVEPEESAAELKKAKIGEVETIAPIEDSKPPEIDIFKDTKTAPVLTPVKKSSKKKIEPLHADELKSDKEEAEPEDKLAEATAPVLPVEETEAVTTDEAESEGQEEAEEPEEPSLTIAEAEAKGQAEAEANEPLSDEETDEAIDEIEKEDSDKVLAAEDAKAAEESEPEHKKPKKADDRSFKEKLGGFFRAWWANKWARVFTILAILAGLGGLAAWPASRYFILNTAGVHSSASLTITDGSTGLPLKNVSVQIGMSQTKTDESGTAKFDLIKLGSQQLQVNRVAFAPINKTIVIGWGSNPLGEMSLTATGAQYTFDVKDYLSNKPVKAEADSGDASAFSDKNGKIVLTVENPETDTLHVMVKSDQYRTEDLHFSATTKDVFSLRMVPAQPVVYVSKKSGKYDVYKEDVDGKNKKLLLAGTGRERSNIGLATSPDGTQAALTSSRGIKRDASGYLLDTLTLINLKDSTATTVDEAENIRTVDWVGKRLVYTVTYAAPSAATGDREKIISYDTSEKARSVLATSDAFNNVMSAKGYVYYAIASSDPNQQASFVRIKTDGSGKQTILNKQVWTVDRVDITKLSLQTPEGWYDYVLGASDVQKGNPPSDNFVSRQYVPNSDGSKTLWIENRDGKGVLLVHDNSANKDSLVVSASGVSMPVHWLSNTTVLYRIANSNETASYVKSLKGGDAKKISDVTPTFGLGANY